MSYINIYCTHNIYALIFILYFFCWFHLLLLFLSGIVMSLGFLKLPHPRPSRGSSTRSFIRLNCQQRLQWKWFLIWEDENVLAWKQLCCLKWNTSIKSSLVQFTVDVLGTQTSGWAKWPVLVSCFKMLCVRFLPPCVTAKWIMVALYNSSNNSKKKKEITLGFGGLFRNAGSFIIRGIWAKRDALFTRYIEKYSYFMSSCTTKN